VLRADDPGWTARAAALALRAPARAGRCRVVALEGRSGAGKTSLAGELAAALSCPVVHMDDLYPGWDGLAASVPLARDHVLEPLRRGADPRWPRYDWEREGYDGWAGVRVADRLVIEGCGAGAADLRPYLSLLLWVEAPRAERGRRLARRWDADLYAPHRARWARQEESYAAAHAPRAHADAVLDNTAPADPAP
jgi:uridine kinase